MTQIFNLQDARHRQTQDLLPWYANGSLAPAETSAVEKHLAECDACRADLEHERVLSREVASLPLDVEHGWSKMQDRLAAPRPLAGGLLRHRVPLVWALAAQAACLALVVGGMTLMPSQPVRLYRALGASTPPANGNLVVMFKPDSSEAALRGVLRETGARIVDGPTISGAYVLHVDTNHRTSVLKRLRTSTNVALAEPIDAESRP